MPATVSSQKLVKALQMAHAYVTRLCADLKPGELDWHTKGCAETVRKQLEHLTGAERRFASRMGWQVPDEPAKDDLLGDYAQLLAMYVGELKGRKRAHLKPFAGKEDTGDHAGWVTVRMCFHALFHGPRITLLRRQRNPRWKAPRPADAVYWGQVCDYLTTLMGD